MNNKEAVERLTKMIDQYPNYPIIIGGRKILIESIEIVTCYVDPDDEENVVYGLDNIDAWYKDLIRDKICTEEEFETEYRPYIQPCLVIYKELQ